MYLVQILEIRCERKAHRQTYDGRTLWRTLCHCNGKQIERGLDGSFSNDPVQLHGGLFSSSL